MTGLGECVYKDGLEKGIQAMVLDNMEECVSADRILLKLQKHFELTGEEAEQYYKRFAQDE